MTAPGGGDRPNPPRSELVLRVVSGLVMAAVALLATWAGGLVFSVFWLAAAIAIASEWIAMTRSEPGRILTAIAGLGLLVIVVGVRISAPTPAILAVAALVLAGLAGLGRDARSRGWAIAGFGYAAILALVPMIVRDRPDLGALAILWMFAVVWTTDIAAFFVGRRFGGPRLWPRVSPKKTWSGFVAGVAAAAFAGTAVAVCAPGFAAGPPVELVAGAFMSAIGSVASQAGDLGESALKRRCDVKDSGRLIPGHGGVMDRLDGFVAVALLVGLALAGSRVVAR